LSGTATIYSVGILDSISAGILLYAGVAQLLVGDWLAGEMRTASTGRVVTGAISLFLGLFAMALIGKWA
jgi:zinc transporter 1/2/3